MLSRLHSIVTRWRLLRHGRALMHRYISAVDEIAGGDPYYAERVCPSLRFLRRRGKACAKLMRMKGVRS